MDNFNDLETGDLVRVEILNEKNNFGILIKSPDKVVWRVFIPKFNKISFHWHWNIEKVIL